MTNIRKSIKISRFDKKKYHCKPLKSLWKAPQRKGTAMKFRIMAPKKPNSAKRRIVRIILTNNLWVTAKIKGQGHSLQVYSEVLACGGRANDLPGVRFNMVKGGTYGFSFKENFNRKSARSKYGKTIDDHIYTTNEEYEKKLEELKEQENFTENVDYESNFGLIGNRYANFGDLKKMNEKYANWTL